MGGSENPPSGCCHNNQRDWLYRAVNPHEGKRNIRLTIEYDGTRYVGWQRQKNGISIQEKIEDALARHLGETVRTTAAGRTDSGVHALGQVANFFTTTKLSPHAIARGLLPLLPRDIAVVSAAEADPHFDARRSARLRWYRYFLSNRNVRPAVASDYLTRVPGRLDFARMNAACDALAGDHDFRVFRAITCTATRTRLTMRRPVITELPDGIITMDFRCQSFLQNMVRILTGTIISCGRGKIGVKHIQEMLNGGARLNEAETLKPNGLFLWRIFYEGEEMPVEGEKG